MLLLRTVVPLPKSERGFRWFLNGASGLVSKFPFFFVLYGLGMHLHQQHQPFLVNSVQHHVWNLEVIFAIFLLLVVRFGSKRRHGVKKEGHYFRKYKKLINSYINIKTLLTFSDRLDLFFTANLVVRQFYVLRRRSSTYFSRPRRSDRIIVDPNLVTVTLEV